MLYIRILHIILLCPFGLDVGAAFEPTFATCCLIAFRNRVGDGFGDKVTQVVTFFPNFVDHQWRILPKIQFPLVYKSRLCRARFPNFLNVGSFGRSANTVNIIYGWSVDISNGWKSCASEIDLGGPINNYFSSLFDLVFCLQIYLILLRLLLLFLFFFEGLLSLTAGGVVSLKCS